MRYFLAATAAVMTATAYGVLLAMFLNYFVPVGVESACDQCKCGVEAGNCRCGPDCGCCKKCGRVCGDPRCPHSK